MSRWSGYIGFLLAVAGAAIGLGNIWKFPYMVGDNGGSAFVILYIFFVIVLGAPMMLAELVIGRSGKSEPIQSIKTIVASDTTWWRSLGVLIVVTAWLILTFYTVISGFALKYLFFSINSGFTNWNIGDINNYWYQFTARPTKNKCFSS